MHPHLTKGEAWMLRRIDLHDLTHCTFDIKENDWPPPEKIELSERNAREL